MNDENNYISMRCPEMSRILTYGGYSALRAGRGCDLAEYPDTTKLRKYENAKLRKSTRAPRTRDAAGDWKQTLCYLLSKKKNVLFFSILFSKIYFKG